MRLLLHLWHNLQNFQNFQNLQSSQELLEPTTPPLAHLSHRWVSGSMSSVQVSLTSATLTGSAQGWMHKTEKYPH